MLFRIPERWMHWVRCLLTFAWLVIIASLLYDPWTPALTKLNQTSIPQQLANSCIHVQGKCFSGQSYSLGTTLMWGVIVPASIFILLVFGHELWRRICPLSFLSQIPRALGWQRQSQWQKKKAGKLPYKLAKVSPKSWLGKNYPYLQFGWLFIGLCGRILLFDADRLVLALWLLLTIALAIIVGYLYGGKTWCNYFCPMAPVEKIYSQPSGLFSSKADMSKSMCRIVLPDGKEQIACVACQNSCIDIDAERGYWESLKKPAESFVRYGYSGLVIGFFVDYYLYAGNWEYYFSGAWVRQSHQMGTLLSPGLYLFRHQINLPKIITVPIILGGFTAIAYILGRFAEKQAKAYCRRRNLTLSSDIIRHRIFTISTFGIFNFFFIFAGRPLILLAPLWIQYIYNLLLVLLSTLWFSKTLPRRPHL
ncbi:4Fe-4S binding protein [Nostoc sp. LEGE 06077]|uniref:4Fe-4S binding protein n=1 Tax=Nostoc sp. LEGE 06077 TaxID=915325 RepID=UPI001880DB6D|nr:4Fe-4S binding protein [Nostoc sp. LEGE 06077]MBE9206664.1 4Fe-4S binding protein [Nostoc sp. LEGE 06077]